jgi:hypothetical protein
MGRTVFGGLAMKNFKHPPKADRQRAQSSTKRIKYNAIAPPRRGGLGWGIGISIPTGL